MDGCMKRKRETHRTSFSPKYLIQNPTCLKQPVTRVLVLNTVTDQTNKVYKIEKTQVKLQKKKKKIRPLLKFQPSKWDFMRLIM